MDTPIPKGPYPVSPAAWYAVWFAAAQAYSPGRMLALLQRFDPADRAPLLWVLFSSPVGFLPYFIAFARSGRTVSLGLLCSPLIFAVLGLFGVALVTALVSFIASNLLGGKGSYAELIYLFAAVYSPLSILRGVVAGAVMFVPAAGQLYTAVLLYQWFLFAVAARAVQGFSWWRAILAVLPVGIGIFLLSWL
jgi:hypothetical protein